MQIVLSVFVMAKAGKLRFNVKPMEDEKPKTKYWLLHAIMSDYVRFFLSGGGRGGMGESGRNGLLAVLCLFGLFVSGTQGYTVIDALRHGAGLKGIVQWQGGGTHIVVMPILTVIKEAVGIAAVSLIVLTSIIAYWCGLLNQFEDDAD